jgi:PAS domain S-box-containing protein
MLREHADWLRLAIHASNIGFWDWDVRTTHVKYSREWKTQLGYEEHEISDEFREWESRVHPDDLPPTLEHIQRYLADPHAPYEREIRMRHKDGSWRWIRIRAELVRDASGAPVRMMGCHIDVTDIRLAQETVLKERDLSAQIVNSLPGLFYVLDQRGRLLRWNANYERVSGYSSAELRGLNTLVLVRESERALVQERMRGIFEGGGATDMEIDLITKDGRTIPHHFTGRRILLNDNPCLIGVGLSTEDLRRAEDARLELEAQLRQAQKMEALGTLAGGIAHDFNNLLGTIIGNAQLANEDLRDGRPAQESLSEILRAGRRARELIRRILTFSRPRDQQLQPVRLRPVLEEAVRLLRSIIPAGVELAFNSAADVPAVRADPSQIHQILLNLATNAWHAMDGHSGRIEIRLDASQVDQAQAQRNPDLHPGSYVRLAVSDTGQGMDAPTLTRIFEPFFTTKAPGQGTGLGLSVVHGIVRNHGGAIVVESEVGRGSTFTLYLPVSETPVSAAPLSFPSGAQARGLGEHILYLDDEESLVSLAERYLARLGYRFTGCTRAADAVAAFRADPQAFDLVITDSNMPGMSGMDVARQVLALRPDTPVVLTSGYLRAEEIEQALALGIREVVLKPDTIDELGPAVKRLLSA